MTLSNVHIPKGISKTLTGLLCAVLLNGVILNTAFAVTPSTPHLVNYQGRLTDAGGIVVPNGPQTVTFRVWNDAVASAPANLIWNSGAVSVTTTSGLFTVALGQTPMAPIDPTDFLDSSRWLGITVGADPEISPCSKLTSVPYAWTASSAYSAIEAGTAIFAPDYLPLSGGAMTGNTSHLDASSQWQFSAQPWMEINPGIQFCVGYGSDGLEQFRIWGSTWGELILNDLSGNNTTAYLSANLDGGGLLELNKETGSPGMRFSGGTTSTASTLTMRNSAGTVSASIDAGLTGNGAVLLPSSSISAGEMFDEPGVANTVTSFSFPFAAISSYTLDSVDITIPAAGYVEVTAGGYVVLSHVIGTYTEVYFTVDKTASNAAFGIPGSSVHRVGSASPTDGSIEPISCARLFSEGAGTHRYYYNARKSSGLGTPSVNIRWIRAKYFPTAYGTVDLTIPAISPVPGDAANPSLVSLDRKVITVEEHNARVEAELAAQRAEIGERMAKLEAEMKAMRDQQAQTTSPKQ